MHPGVWEEVVYEKSALILSAQVFFSYFKKNYNANQK